MWLSCEHHVITTPFYTVGAAPPSRPGEHCQPCSTKWRTSLKGTLHIHSTCLCVTAVHVLYLRTYIWRFEQVTLTWLRFLHTVQNDSQFSGASVAFFCSFTDYGTVDMLHVAERLSGDILERLNQFWFWEIFNGHTYCMVEVVDSLAVCLRCEYAHLSLWINQRRCTHTHIHTHTHTDTHARAHERAHTHTHIRT